LTLSETEEGFTLVTAKQVHFPVVELEASASHDASLVAPVIPNVRHLHQILGPTPFLSLAYCLMVGRQLILRGQPSGLITSIANCLNVSICAASCTFICSLIVHKTKIYIEVMVTDKLLKNVLSTREQQ
jgi:hypothetical protein